MTAFDEIRATHEQMAGMSDILRTLRQQENEAEEAMSAAENKLNSIRKLHGYAKIEMERLIAKLDMLEQTRR